MLMLPRLNDLTDNTKVLSHLDTRSGAARG